MKSAKKIGVCMFFNAGCITQTIKNVLTFLQLDKHEYSYLREDIDFGLLIAKKLS